MFKLVVLLSAVALAAAKPSPYVPIAYTAVPAVSSVSQYSNSVVHGAPVVPAVYSASYSPYVTGVVPVSALSQAPNSPAVVLDAVNGVPLDTPEVVASRIAHYQAKALAGVHHLAKRSLVPVTYSSVVAPGFHNVVSPVYSAPYGTTYTAPFASTYGYSAVVPKALSVHPW
ncbi:cuticle protein 18.7-like [Vanessa atalanta]|uniref:cuticle protein 18.7-like n=1 Tax=Vanessa atalanta TaxID=42275 RepID=UPI001FCCF407|nr:cuticle protein 18.7-like [Vanessa atalanta]